MKHLRYFETTSAFKEAYTNEYVEPWVSYTEEDQEINYNKLTKIPLTFTILDDYTYLFWHETGGGNMQFRIYVSVNGEEEFYVDTSSTYSGTCIGTFYAGDEITVRGENEVYANPNDTSVHANFVSSGRVSVKGNIMSLIYKNNFEDKIYFPQGTHSNFFGLFIGSVLIDASKLILPAMTLTDYCYCYMFGGCTSLTKAPVLPATTLALSCYNGMFNYCSSLTTAPELPATTLADNCYSGMFWACMGLTTAPVLPATTLTNYCYNNMFYHCTSLNYIKCLATDISASNCLQAWVDGVAASGTFVKNPSMSGWGTGDSGIPSGWTVQDAS